MDLHAVCCILFLLLTCSGRGFGQVLELPDSINKTVGENVVITPKRLPGPPYYTVSWSFNTVTILTGSLNDINILPPYNDRVSFNTTSLALALRSLTESDTGQYVLTVVTANTYIGQTSLLVIDSGGDGEDVGSLSAGAIAGIVIGVLLGVAAIAGLIFYLVRDKKTSETNSSGNRQNGATPNEGQHELHYAEVRHNRKNQGQPGLSATTTAPTPSYVPGNNKTATSNPAGQIIYSDVRNL